MLTLLKDENPVTMYIAMLLLEHQGGDVCLLERRTVLLLWAVIHLKLVLIRPHILDEYIAFPFI